MHFVCKKRNKKTSFGAIFLFLLNCVDGTVRFGPGRKIQKEFLAFYLFFYIYTCSEFWEPVNMDSQ